ncbi:MAG TPA: phosphate ABC transporter permease PstA [Tepidisphaeraceae bacterium]|jgi:phosphate transport system permease protein|nr:phosphate ABC transporter permease PstA [Tepidisphaeraceae bacterium]
MTSSPLPSDRPAEQLPDYQGARVSFNRNLRSRRTLTSAALSILAGTLTVIACVPLLSVLIMLIWRGGARLVMGGIATLTQLPPGPLDTGGGFGNAIEGTLVMVGVAAVISVPFGILAAIFLAEYGAKTKIATAIRFAAKIMTGLPSILAGVFAYAAIVMLTGKFSALAGGIALSVLMIPIVLLTAEEAVKMVPRKMKDAAIGMGCTQAQVTWKIIVPTAMPGILTGVMLAVARAAGETAPLLFTALASANLWAIDSQVPYVHLINQETESMAVFIYNASSSPQSNLIELAWAASLVLVIMVLIFNVGGQILSQRGKPAR